MLLVYVAFLSMWLQPAPAGLTVEARFLRMAHLPPGLDFAMLNNGFGVCEVKLKNTTKSPTAFDPSQIALTDLKNKPVERAVPTEIAPKVVDKWSTGGDVMDVRSHREVDEYGRRWPTGTDVMVGGGRETQVVHASKGQQIRGVLEKYEIKKMEIPAEGDVTLLIYFKTKKHPLDFVGSKLTLNPEVSTVILPPYKAAGVAGESAAP